MSLFKKLKSPYFIFQRRHYNILYIPVHTTHSHSNRLDRLQILNGNDLNSLKLPRKRKLNLVIHLVKSIRFKSISSVLCKIIA